ncbi:hypothetical protein [Adlercreutzia sp. ZJ473]|uniref:hypothetical protein n=1 Tax=Adlercreutzia sp. ZJ473 TaxID=2722822 RepID=UPI001555D0C6|nr:hypothetical protein [Adlercreutzia sp. ZJ473]
MAEIKESTIFVDLLRCTGCWTCALSCMTGNNLKDGQYFVSVRTNGSGEGIDRPSGTWPDLRMSWMPIYSKHCVKCTDRTAEGRAPYCVGMCPNKALSWGEEVEGKIEACRERGSRIFQLPRWENSREDVIYASADREII